ncbi:small GTP-binding protein [Tritrichomonas foetus]|uniref:Small GTP-binding protein n=1 Tax=Tritrichomonas foetus TaxID=1144522 RepID=A0A1J4K3I4_9EUKA|nr:small GTP-binding protein [Tritrichomonas foetus]|eukprot:OHT05935.1 small GTP-binding protein [Tritrichomonas foetus]
MSIDDSPKIAILGTGGVGKTCVVLRLVNNTFDTEYLPTIQDFFDVKMVYEGVTYTIKLIDTAGQEEMASIADISIKEANSFIIVYSVTSSLSFAEAEKYYHKIAQNSTSYRDRIVLLGNKCDMVGDRQVSSEKGRELANKIGCEFYETSAKTGINIKDAFTAIMRVIVQSNMRRKTENDSKETNEKEDSEEEGNCCSIM